MAALAPLSVIAVRTERSSRPVPPPSPTVGPSADIGQIALTVPAARCVFQLFTHLLWDVANAHHSRHPRQPEAVSCPVEVRAAITCSVSRGRTVPRRADRRGAAGLVL